MRCMAVGTPAPSRAVPCSAPRRAQRARGIARAQQVAGQGKVYIDAVEKEAAAFAPATVANLGPGFDWMGCAVEVSEQLWDRLRMAWGTGPGLLRSRLLAAGSGGPCGPRHLAHALYPWPS